MIPTRPPSPRTVRFSLRVRLRSLGWDYCARECRAEQHRQLVARGWRHPPLSLVEHPWYWKERGKFRVVFAGGEDAYCQTPHEVEGLLRRADRQTAWLEAQ